MRRREKNDERREVYGSVKLQHEQIKKAYCIWLSIFLTIMILIADSGYNKTEKQAYTFHVNITFIHITTHTQCLTPKQIFLIS